MTKPDNIYGPRWAWVALAIAVLVTLVIVVGMLLGYW